MAAAKPRARLVAALAALVVCLGVAGVTVPGKLLGPSKSATVPVEPVLDTPVETGSPAARDLLLSVTLRPALESRPRHSGRLFFWSEEIASGKSIWELWKEEDARPKAAPDLAVEAATSRPRISAEDLARARAIAVRGIVVGQAGSWAVLSTGRVRPNDRIAGLPFRVESIAARSVTLSGEGEQVVLELPASRPGKVRTVGN